MTNTPIRPETMLERVARAIHDAAHKGLGFHWAKEMRMVQASAAMQEISDPTDLMVSHGATYGLSAGDTRALFKDMITEAMWSSVKPMITAALGDGK